MRLKNKQCLVFRAHNKHESIHKLKAYTIQENCLRENHKLTYHCHLFLMKTHNFRIPSADLCKVLPKFGLQAY